MSEKIRFVAINGPRGVGKSWVADHLEQRIAATTRVRIHRVSFQDVLRKGAMNLLGVPNADYDSFKRSTYFGKTGRQWMISLSEDFMKIQAEEQVFSMILHETMNDIMLSVPIGYKNLFIADSWGFESEINYFRVQPEVDVLACSIEPPGHAHRGEPWITGDSRYNLAHMASVVAEDSTSMLEKLERALDRRGWT